MKITSGADKKNYYKLDDIGFVGTQGKISAARKKADIKKTADIIHSIKTGKVFSMPQALRNKVAQ